MIPAPRLGPLLRRRCVRPPLPGGRDRDPRRPAAGDRHERGRAGARLQPGDAHGPDPLRRLDRVALAGRPSASSSEPGFRRLRHRRAGRRDRGRRPCRAPRGRPRGRHPQPHVPRRGRGHAGRHRTRRGGHRRPMSCSTVHSSRDPLRRGPRAAPAADAAIDHLIAVSTAIERKIADEGRDGAPVSSSTTAWTSSATTTRSRAARCATSTAWSRGRSSWASSPGWNPRRVIPRSSRPGRRSSARVPNAYLIIVGEGSRREALGRWPRAEDRAPRHVHRPSRRRAGGHGGAGCRGPAVLSRGAGPLDPRGDGAVTPGGRDECRRHPRDHRGRRGGLLVRRMTPTRSPTRSCDSSGPPLRGHDRPLRPRPGPRPVLPRAHGPRHPEHLRRIRPKHNHLAAV